MWTSSPDGAWERIEALIDEGTFQEMDADVIGGNPLAFPDYEKKLEADRKKTGLNEACVSGVGELNGHSVVLAVMDPHFRMASMGAAVGEKLTRAIEKQLKRNIL